MEGKKGFVLYIKHKDLINRLTDEEAGILIKKIFSYCSDLNPGDTGHPIVEIAFEAIRADLKEDLAKWKTKAEANRKNGKLGGRPKKENPKNPDGLLKTQEENAEPKKADKDKVKDKVKELSKDNNNNRVINNSCSNQALSDTKFDTFWKAYPRKTGKQKCLNWFKIHKPSDALVQKMVQTIEAFKKSNQWRDPQYIPYPYTWLNRGGWDDELEVKKNQPKAAQEEIIWETL